MNAGRPGGPAMNTRSGGIYGFQQKSQAKMLPPPTKENIDDIISTLKQAIAPSKKMQMLSAIKQDSFKYLTDLCDIFNKLD